MANPIGNAVVLNEIERVIERNNYRISLRNLRDASNAFDLPETIFIKHFRISKEAVLYLIEALSQHMNPTHRSTALPIHLKILATLNFYGQGSYQHAIGSNHVLAMSQPSLSRCIKEISELINTHLLGIWIKFPTDADTLNEKKMGFFNKYNVNGVIGAIDGTHVSIIAPPDEDPNYPGRVYYNRKGYTSINTQIICDSDLNILSINARYPGSTHDAAIWSTSGIRRHLLNKYVNGLLQNTFLIGDSGYPLEPWLMTPVDGAQEGTPEFIYNEKHITIRNPIERLNGVLKSRFRSLLRHRTLNYHPVQAGLIINSCAVLHNIAQFYNVDVPEEDMLDNPPEPNNGGDERPYNDRILHQGQWYAEGVRVRNNLIQHII